ncbi:MAG: dihydroorotate dehydrogenase PyrD [Thermoproteota archaeon]
MPSSRLRTSVAGIELEHPVMNASGILGESPETVQRLAGYGVSAIVTKSFTREPREGYATPISVPVACGLLNAVGLANPGVSALPLVVAAAKSAGKPVVVSIAGATVDEFVEIAAVAEDAGADAIELNLSCPHSERRGLEIGMDFNLSYRVVREVSSTVKIPVLAKLGVVDRLVDLAGRLLSAGAAGFTLINTLRAMKIDVYAARPVLGYGVGGLSGRAIHPVAVRAVYEVYAEHSPDIVGVGGIETWEDAVELMLAGAKAVQVGTALVVRGPEVISSILEGIEKYLEYTGAGSVAEIVGAAHRR